MPDSKECWRGEKIEQDKPWGKILTWKSAFQGANGRFIYIEKGKRTSLKYHNLKNETFFVFSGLLKIIYGNSDSPKLSHPVSGKDGYLETLLSRGEIFHVHSECPYRLEAIEDCEILEIGDDLRDQPIILFDDFGRT